MKLLGEKNIKRWFWAVVAFCIIATSAVYYYLNSKQSFTASATIEYTGSSAANNYNPDGTEIDASEIYDAKVIAKALEAMGSEQSVSSVRARITVTPVIPDDEQDKIDSALDNGYDYEYNPTQFVVTYVSPSSEQNARSVLSNVLTQYFEVYGERHVSSKQLPADCSSLVYDAYDYLENAEIIKSSVDDTILYLQTQAYSYPDWRSSLTGYSFSDLLLEYNDITELHVYGLYAKIILDRATKDYDTLLNKYLNRIAIDELNREKNVSLMDDLTVLMEAYIQKSKKVDSGGAVMDSSADSSQASDSSVGSDDLSASVLAGVYQSNITTTEYDVLVNEYVAALEQNEHLETDIKHCNYILSAYGGDESAVTAEDGAVNELLDSALAAVTELYAKIEMSSSEFNSYLGALNIGTVSSVSVEKAVNMKLYMAVAVVLFLIVGCIGALVIRRVIEFVSRAMYTDGKTGLKNRLSLDGFIEAQDKKVGGAMAVVSLYIENLRVINRDYGYETGDETLSVYGKCIAAAAGDKDSCFHNGSGRFFIFMPDASYELARSVVSFLFRRLHGDSRLPVDFTYGITQTEHDNQMSARELMIKASSQHNRNNPDEDGQNE